jgi:hypothetical protein
MSLADSIIVLLFFSDFFSAKSFQAPAAQSILIFMLLFNSCSAMGKEVDMSTDEESDCVVICPPNGNADHEKAVSGSHDEDSPERQETPHTIVSNMDSNVQEDMPVNQDLPKLIHQQESSPPDLPAKPVNAGQQDSGHMFPEPCSIATDRKSSEAGNCTPVAHPTSSGEKISDRSSTSTRSMAKKVC